MKQKFASFSDINIKKRGVTIFAMVLLITLMAGMFVSCTTVDEGAKTPPTSSDENQKTGDVITQEEPDTQTETTEKKTLPAVKTDSGSYMGQVDNNSIEIKISGIQDDKLAYRVFKISDDVRLAFEGLSLKEDDEVKIDYYEEAIGQPVMIKIERISN